MKSFNIGLAGYGTVGRNFCEMLNTRKEDLERFTNHKINIKKILVKTKKYRFFNFTTSLVYDYKELFLIFEQKVKENSWHINNDIDNLFFKDNYNLFPAYGRDIENFLNKVKIMYSRRIFINNLSNNKIIIKLDLENALNLYKKHISNKDKKDTLPEHMYN